MTTTCIRSTNLISKLDGARDISINVEGIDAIIEFSYHGQKRGHEGELLDSAIVFMVQRAFNEILDLKHGKQFLIKDEELDMSIVGQVRVERYDIIISVVSAINSAEPRNPYHTLEIAI